MNSKHSQQEKRKMINCLQISWKTVMGGLTAAVFFLGLSLPGEASLIINDSFAAADYSGTGFNETGKNPNTGTGDGTAWHLVNYHNESTTTVYNVGDGALNLSSTRGTLLGPVNHFDARTLANVGDSLTLTVNASASATSSTNNAFTLVLANSNGDRFAANHASNLNVPNGGTWDAYAVVFPSGTNNGGRILENEATTASLFRDSDRGAAGRLDTPNVAGAGLDGTAKDFVLKLEREAGGLRITGMFGNTAFGNALWENPETWTFDTVALSFAGNVMRLSASEEFEAHIHSVQLEYIPEPSTLVLLGVAGLVLMKRRRV